MQTADFKLIRPNVTILEIDRSPPTADAIVSIPELTKIRDGYLSESAAPLAAAPMSLPQGEIGGIVARDHFDHPLKDAT